MIKAELIIDTRFKSKKGFPVKIRVYDDIQKIHKYVGLKVYQDGPELKLDSFLRKRMSELDDQILFCNENLYSISEAINVIENGVPMNDIDIEIELLEKRLELLKKKKGLNNGIGFIDFTRKLMNERKILKKPTRTYDNVTKVVLKFISPLEDIPINSITREWVNNFDLFFSDRKMKDSSIKTQLGIIKSIYTEAQSRESLNIKKDNPFVKLRTFKTEKKIVDLSIEDIIKVKNINPDDIKKVNSILNIDEIKQMADLYVFQFAIGGHDLADIAYLKWENIKGNRIQFKRFKNRFKKSEGELIDNMLNPFCLDVIEKYGNKESNRIFTLIPNPESESIEYHSFSVRMNRTVYRIIRQNAKIVNKFTSKSTRYLFRTTAGNLLINDFIVMKIQGHTPQGVTFGYQGAINYDVQDKEHNKVLDLVFK